MSSDITMCMDTECPLRFNCYRYLAMPDAYKSIFAESPRIGDKCDYHWKQTADEKEEEKHEAK